MSQYGLILLWEFDSGTFVKAHVIHILNISTSIFSLLPTIPNNNQALMRGSRDYTHSRAVTTVVYVHEIPY